MLVSVVKNAKKEIHCFEVCELKIKFDENDRAIEISFKQELNSTFTKKKVEGCKVFVNGRDIRTKTKTGDKK